MDSIQHIEYEIKLITALYAILLHQSVKIYDKTISKQIHFYIALNYRIK